MTSISQLSYRAAFSLIVKRDLMIAFRHRDDIINPLLFFIIVAGTVLNHEKAGRLFI